MRVSIPPAVATSGVAACRPCVRIATSARATAGVVLGIAGVVGIATWRHEPPLDQPRVDIAASIDREIEPSSSTAIHEPPPPPEGPFYASLFVGGKTWTLPCSYGGGQRSGTMRCQVQSVEVAAFTTARIGC